MAFNPLDDRLTVTDLQVTDDVTIGDDLTVAGSTNLGVGLKIQSLNAILTQTCKLLCSGQYSQYRFQTNTYKRYHILCGVN
jgi:hypothetical protein